MKIAPLPISLNENTVQKESDSISDTAGSIEEQYNELVEINELLCGELKLLQEVVKNEQLPLQ